MAATPPSSLWNMTSAGASLALALILVTSPGCGSQDPSFEHGREIYKNACLACHGLNGAGVLYSKSVLNNNPFVTGNPDELIAVILFGRMGSGAMPGWSKKLNDQEVAAVTTYIRQAWSNQAEAVTAAMVQKIRGKE
jgi:mono/diheme cytochrome c family protein